MHAFVYLCIVWNRVLLNAHLMPILFYSCVQTAEHWKWGLLASLDQIFVTHVQALPIVHALQLVIHACRLQNTGGGGCLLHEAIKPCVQSMIKPYVCSSLIMHTDSRTLEVGAAVSAA